MVCTGASLLALTTFCVVAREVVCSVHIDLTKSRHFFANFLSPCQRNSSENIQRYFVCVIVVD